MEGILNSSQKTFRLPLPFIGHAGQVPLSLSICAYQSKEGTLPIWQSGFMNQIRKLFKLFYFGKIYSVSQVTSRDVVFMI